MPVFATHAVADVTVALLCDRCDAVVVGGGVAAAEAVGGWRDDGWRIDRSGSLVRCPACR